MLRLLGLLGGPPEQRRRILGTMSELPVEPLYRLARLLRIGGGTSEIQRYWIAKTLGL